MWLPHNARGASQQRGSRCWHTVLQPGRVGRARPRLRPLEHVACEEERGGGGEGGEVNK